MRASVLAIGAALRNAITRGKVVAASLNPKRTLLQISMLANETKNNVELLLPYGMSALPLAGGDVIAFQIGGTRDHVVALPCDDPALRITDLQPGEYGFRDAVGSQIVFRKTGIVVTSPLEVSLASSTKLRLQAPIVEIVATTTIRHDVGGYADEMTYQGGTNYEQTTWQQGATVTITPNPVDPPQHFHGP